MKIIDCVQGSAEWLAVRTGRITASEVADAIAMLKRNGKEGRKAGESSAVREAYKAALVGEILTGQAADNFVSKWMDRGTEMEPIARAAYELRYDTLVDTVGFVIHPTIDRAGCSPDGLMAKKGVEFKVPKIDTHIKWMRAGVLPTEHEPQVQMNMGCTEMEAWDFVSFCPELPERYRLFTVPVIRDDMRIAEIDAGINQCLAEVDEIIADLMRINPELVIAPKADPMAWAGEAMLTGDDIDHFFASQEAADGT